MEEISCPSCRTPCEPDAVFCPVCGTHLSSGQSEPVSGCLTFDETTTCPTCQNSVAKGKPFCPYCGQPLQMAKSEANLQPEPPQQNENVNPSASETTFEASPETVEPYSAVEPMADGGDELASGAATIPEEEPIYAFTQPVKTYPTIVPQSIPIPKSSSKFPWFFMLTGVLLIAGLIYLFFFMPIPKTTTDFKDANSARNWQFVPYSQVSFAKVSNGLSLYDGIYTLKDNYPDVTAKITASVKNDTSISPNGYFCIWLRYNPGIKKGYCFIIKPITLTALLGVAGDPNPISIDLRSTIAGFDPYKPHIYTAEAKGESFRFLIDNIPIATLYDVGIIKGQITLEANGLGVLVNQVEIIPGK